MDYRQSLNLPQTEFPMKANLTQREPVRLEKWNNEGSYAKLQQICQRENRPKFILHDGPPYANGHIHLGTSINKILKDFVLRSRTMDGYWCPYTPGWDTHGLPIELNVIKQLGEKRHKLTPLELREKCKEYAFGFVDIQRKDFQRLGVWADWQNPYLTLHHQYEASQIRVFGAMANKGYIYKGLKPVYWCASCETALAEAEIEYEDHDSHSIFVKFRVTEPKDLPTDKPLSAIIWTTTPWTLPANLAVCVHPDFIYALVEVGDEYYIVASELVESVAKQLGWSHYHSVVTKTGKELEGVVCQHPFIKRSSPIILGDHVTLEQGTGCVHTAPGHGMEDYIVGLRYGLDILTPVDSKGYLTQEAGAYQGQFVFDADKNIIEDMKRSGALLANDIISHSYPHCWRCHNPIVYRATEQWFASVDGFREEALSSIDEVQWIPHWGKDRIKGMVTDRGDWCISRQRVWGVPIPVFYCQDHHHVLLNQDTIEAVAKLFEKEGANGWFAHTAEEILPADAACSECGCKKFVKETDIMDVWFDSGSSHASVLNGYPNLTWPADLYLEGSDQHRGWFQASLLTSVAAFGQPPYKAVLTHGFTVDSEGKKMSKSVGNVIDPQSVIDKYGADILRLWVASSDYRGDLRFSYENMDQVAEVYRRIRNTARFLLGNLHDFSKKEYVPYQERETIDQWAVNRAHKIQQRVIDAYRDYEFHVVFYTVHNFCSVDMGGFYLDVIKDRLYCEDRDARSRRSAQSSLYDILMLLVKQIAPIMPFTAEEIWEYVKVQDREEESVHFTTWAKDTIAFDQKLEELFEPVLRLRKLASRGLEQARNEKMIGSSQEAELAVYVKDEQLYRSLEAYMEKLPEYFITSQVTLYPTKAMESALPGVIVDEEDITVVVRKTDKTKCPRCWRHIVEEETLCQRCQDTMSNS
jgi:isoleucyl-tRNA synthetase